MYQRRIMDISTGGRRTTAVNRGKKPTNARYTRENIISDISVGKRYAPKHKPLQTVETVKKIDHFKQDSHTPTNSRLNPEVKQKKVKPLKHKNRITTLSLYAMATVVFMAGMFVTFQSFRVNQHIVAKASAQEPIHEDTPETEDTSEADSTDDNKASNNIQSYTTAPDMPRFIEIPKIGVKARIKHLGVDAENHILAPSNIYDAAWFNKSAKPGSKYGASVLSGHVSGWYDEGVFKNLDKLTNGDTVTIEMGDGSKLNYEFSRSQSYNKDAVNMDAVMQSAVRENHGLNIITCSGSYDKNSETYSERLVVYLVAK